MKMKNRLAMPVTLCFALAVGILLPTLTPDAGAGTPDAVVSFLVEDGYIRITPIVETKGSAPDPAISLLVDGEIITMASPALLIGSTTYVPLYDFCRLVGPVAMTQDEYSATVFLPDLLIMVVDDNHFIKANGRYLYAPTLCKMIDNVMYVPIRTLAKALGAEVSWDFELRTVFIFPPFEPIEHGDSFYNETDLYWMSRIISAEARGECMYGKIAVGNVVMNRLRSSIYPNSVRGVIFDNRSGIQFSPAYSGAINRTPDSECIIAAKLALDDADIVGDSLFFNAVYVRSSWASRNRTFVTTIGNHNFYA